MPRQPGAQQSLPPGVVYQRPARVLDAYGRSPEDRPFSPSPPPKPELPRGTFPRAFFPPISANQERTPRSGWEVNLTSFQILRAFAKAPPVQSCMRDIAGQILGMKWDVVPIEGEKTSPALEKKAARVKAWMRMPYAHQRMSMRPWLYKVVREILVTDALSIFPHYNVGGEFLGLRLIDGATILPLVDSEGMYPVPPEMGGEEGDYAFEQVKDGRVETSFYLNELWYRPLCPQPDTPYGESPTESVLLLVNLYLRKLFFDLSYYTEGNIPEGLFSLPDNWTPEMIREYQEGFNAEIAAGVTARAGYLKFVPPGAYHALKAFEFNLDQMENLIRQIFMPFGVSPLPAVKSVNRSQGEVMESSTMESGIRPVVDAIAEIFTETAHLHLDAPELCVKPAEDETEDADLVYRRSVAFFERGGLTVNEFLEQTGSETVEGELGDERLLMTGQGPQFLSDILAERKMRLEARRREIENPPALPGGAQAGQDTSTPPPDSGASGAEASDEAAKDLARWQTFTLKRIREGKSLRKFESAAIPARLQRIVTAGLVRAGRHAQRVRKVFEAARLGKAELGIPESAAAAERAIRDLIAGWLEQNRDRIIAEALVWLPAEKLAKDGRLPEHLDINLDMTEMVPKLEAVLSDAAGAGSSDTAVIVGYDLDATPEAALEYARKRAAELVGMKRTRSGDLVENPDKTYAINETLREDIRNKVAAAIEQGWSPQKLTSEMSNAFAPARAETIARTETGFAYNEGAADVYEEAGQEHVEILDGDGCLPTGHQDGAPAPSGAQGVIEEQAEANGQVWTVAQMRERPLGHPRCVRGFVPA